MLGGKEELQSITGPSTWAPYCQLVQEAKERSRHNGKPGAFTGKRGLKDEKSLLNPTRRKKKKEKDRKVFGIG